MHRAAELIAPATDFSWLAEIEKDLALVMEPRSKYDRLVDTDRLVEAGLTLIAEAESSAGTAVARAKVVRDGLMIALLAFCPNRQKNFAALEIGKTFQKIGNSWWIVLDRRHTKTRRPDEPKSDCQGLLPNTSRASRLFEPGFCLANRVFGRKKPATSADWNHFHSGVRGRGRPCLSRCRLIAPW